jgi:hypothetical protein
MITNWNNQTAKLLAFDIEAALSQIATKHGLNPIKVRKMKISGASTLDLGLHAVIRPDNLSQTAKTSSEHAHVLNALNLPIGTVLRSTKYGNCTVYDYASKNPAMPIMATDRTGRTIKFTTGAEVISRPAGFVLRTIDATTQEMYGTKRRRVRGGYQF